MLALNRTFRAAPLFPAIIALFANSALNAQQHYPAFVASPVRQVAVNATSTQTSTVARAKNAFTIYNRCARPTRPFAVAFVNDKNQLEMRGWYQVLGQRAMSIGDVAGNGMFLLLDSLYVNLRHVSQTDQVSGQTIGLPLSKSFFVFKSHVIPEVYTQRDALKLSDRSAQITSTGLFVYVAGDAAYVECESDRGKLIAPLVWDTLSTGRFNGPSFSRYTPTFTIDRL